MREKRKRKSMRSHGILTKEGKADVDIVKIRKTTKNSSSVTSTKSKRIIRRASKKLIMQEKLKRKSKRSHDILTN